jgi:hypothetical protein
MMRRVAALAFLLLAACSAPEPQASVPQERGQTVMIDTPGIEGAMCVVQNGSGIWNVPAPGPVTVPRAPYPLEVNCFKGEHLRGQGHVTPSFAPAEAAAGEDCVSCQYPGIIRVPLVLNDSLMTVPVLRQQP